jgi:MFS family permease
MAVRTQIHTNLLFLSFFCAYVTQFFITPYLSLDILANYKNNSLFIASLIYSMPSIAQVISLRFFNRLAEKKNIVKKLIILGYSVNILQYILLFLASTYYQDAILVLIITFSTNICAVAYIPAIKVIVSRGAMIGTKGKNLSYFSILLSVCFGLGYLVGGFIYNVLPLFIMLIIAIAIATLALVVQIFIPLKFFDLENPTKLLEDVSESTSENTDEVEKTIGNGPHITNSALSFKGALWFQFILQMVAAVFFYLIGAYLQSQNLPPYYWGLCNGSAAIFGTLSLTYFGKIIDRHGPNRLFLFGAVVYAAVYLILLSSTNLFLILIAWSLPGYTFMLATEFLASQEDLKNENILETTTNKRTSELAMKNMADAGFSRRLAIVFGLNIGGAIATIWGFREAMWFGFIGSFSMGIFFIILWIRNSIGMSNNPTIDILIDWNKEPQMSRLQQFLALKGQDSKQISQKQFSRRIKKYQTTNIWPKAMIIYIHNKIHPNIEDILIEYCNGGGTVIILHHGIASAKIKNPKYCEYARVMMHRDNSKPFTWIVRDKGDFTLINLAPTSKITTHLVKYNHSVEFSPVQKIQTSEGSLISEEIEIINDGKISPNWNAIQLFNTELFDNIVLLPDKHREILFGYEYIPVDRTVPNYRGIAGWTTKKNKGRLFDFQLGHSTTDFVDPYCQIILNCIIFRNEDS